MKTNITGRPIKLDPAVVIADIKKAVEFFTEMLTFKPTIETYTNEHRFEVIDAGIDVMIDVSYDKNDDEGEERIFISSVQTTPGCMHMPNGDPGYPPETDYVDLGDFALEQKNEAIERVIGLVAVRLANMRAEAIAEAAYWKQLEEEQRAANAGEAWSFDY